MSMDLSVWSQREFELPAHLPEPGQWQRFGAEFSYEGDGWQVLVLAEPNEPDSLIQSALPAASFVACVSLEPIGAGRTGYSFLERVVRSLARETNGVWVDPSGSPFRHDEGSFT